MLDQALRISGALGLSGLTIAGIIFFAWQTFKHLGAKWLDEKFAERLADYKHRQSQEIEHLRGEIARLLDRTTRLHSAEFEVLPRAWELLGGAFGEIGSCISAIKSYANVTWLNSEELEAALDQPFLREFEKSNIRKLSGNDRQKEYSEIIDYHRYREASNLWIEFNNFVITKGIFLEPGISKQFDEISKRLLGILDDYQFKRFEKNTELGWTEIRNSWKEIDALRATLKEAVVARLWSDPMAKSEI